MGKPCERKPCRYIWDGTPACDQCVRYIQAMMHWRDHSEPDALYTDFKMLSKMYINWCIQKHRLVEPCEALEFEEYAKQWFVMQATQPQQV